MSDDKREFRFKVTPKPGTGTRFTAVLLLTQEEYEDHHLKRDAMRALITGKGLNLAETVWQEDAPSDPDVEERLREVIGCGAEAQMIPKYAHGWEHNAYKQVEIDGVTYRYMGFQNGAFIKYAPEMASEAAPV